MENKNSDMEFSYEKYENLLVNNSFNEATAYRASFIPDFLYKFVSLSANGNKTGKVDKETDEKKFFSLENGEIWFSSRKAMNDPFEFAGIYIDEAKMCNNGWSHDDVAKKKQDLIDLFFLASFTSNMNSLPMWAHYANNHAGYCVQYKVDRKENVHKVTYLSKRYPVANTIEKFVIYGCMQSDEAALPERREKAEIEFQRCLALIREMYISKHISWSYENEFRLFEDALPGKLGRNISAASVGLTPTEVYCGVNCSDKHIKRIQSISEKTGLLFHRCKLSKTDFLILH